MRFRLPACIALASGLCLALAVPAHARWSAEPALVHATANVCPLVAAASDAADGAIVIWQRNDGANPSLHPLTAVHLLANGDLDSQWPVDGVLVSSATTIARTALGAVGDGAGGAYAWWMEGKTLYLTRVASDGSVPSAWPARGRLLGTLASAEHRPQVYDDGSGGVWLGWLTTTVSNSLGRVMHIGPGNTAAGGWPTAGRGFASSDPLAGLTTIQFAFQPVADGALCIAWGDMAWDGAQYVPGSWRVSRTLASGSYAPGWPATGTVLAAFRSDLLVSTPYLARRLVAVAGAVDGGAWVLRSDVTWDGYMPTGPACLDRLGPEGAPAAGWPAGGIPATSPGVSWVTPGGAEYSYDLRADDAGGVFALHPGFSDHGSSIGLTRFSPGGALTSWDGVGDPTGFESVVHPGGDSYLATCTPDGPYGPYSPYARIAVSQVAQSGDKGSGFVEYHTQPAYSWYGDVALAPTSGGGAIFVWSQHNERFGLFARRFTPAGEVTDVPAASAASRTLRLRFEPGRGVVASGTLAPGSRLTLLDVSGRRVGASEAPADGALECVLPGSNGLAPGVYFARAVDRTGAIVRAKVAVWR